MMTRRGFVRRSTVGAALLAAGVRAAPAAATDLSLGFSLYGMKTLPLPRALEECRRIGYRNVELAMFAGFPTDPARLDVPTRARIRSELAAAALPVSSLLISLSLAADAPGHARHLANLELAARFAAEISPASPPLIQTVLGGVPLEWEEKKDLMAGRLKEWDAVARRHGVTIAVKAHVASAVNSPERLLWLFQAANSGNLAIAYDHSHYVLAGLSIPASFAALAPHVRFVHLKDARMDGKDVRFLLPDEGGTDYAAYFQLLRRAGFRGPCVAEVSSQIFNRAGYDPVVAAQRCHAVLAPALHA